MAKLERKDAKIFANNCKETLITEFRTEDESQGTASYSRDPDIIQNDNYSQGWVDDIANLNTKIYGEDLNAVHYVLSYLLKYLYENGIPEWKSTTVYYTNSICRINDVLYISLQDDNVGNDPINTNGFWRSVILDTITSTLAGSGADIVKEITGNNIKFKSISVDGYGSLQDDGDNINIHILGGSGVVDAFWGQIQGSLSNQTDLVSALSAKQDTITADSPLNIDINNEISIPKATTLASGYLDYNDFNTFNNKQDAISATLPISITNNNIAIETAGTSSTGVLSYTDWNNFNNKQDGIQGVQFYYDSSLIKQEPDTNRTSYLGSPLHPYNYAYMDQIGDANNPVTTGYLDDTISGIIHTDDIKAKTVTTPIPNTENRVVTINKINVKWIKSDLFGDNSQTVHAVDISCSEPEGTLATATLGEYRKFNNIKSTKVTVSNLSANTNDTAILIDTNLNPDSTANNRKLGSSTNKFYEGWISYVKTSQLEAMAGGTKLNFGYNYLSPATADQYQLGYQNRFLYVYSAHFDQGSDIRNKRNIKDYEESALEKIKNITPITYNYKDEERTTLGVSAQELRELEPLLVNTQKTEDGKDETLGIDVYSLCIFAIKAIKELNEKVETLEARVNELEKDK